jgi:hypothetical protein
MAHRQLLGEERFESLLARMREQCEQLLAALEASDAGHPELLAQLRNLYRRSLEAPD